MDSALDFCSMKSRGIRKYKNLQKNKGKNQVNQHIYTLGNCLGSTGTRPGSRFKTRRLFDKLLYRETCFHMAIDHHVNVVELYRDICIQTIVSYDTTYHPNRNQRSEDKSFMFDILDIEFDILDIESDTEINLSEDDVLETYLVSSH